MCLSENTALEACLKVKSSLLYASNQLCNKSVHTRSQIGPSSYACTKMTLFFFFDLAQYRTYNFMIKTTYGYSLETFQRG